MSYKATAFGYTESPKTLSRFVVYIPGILNSPIRVWSSKEPQSYLSVVPLPVAGQTINLPGKKQYPGQWFCKVYESLAFDVAFQMTLLKARTWNEGLFVPLEPLVMLTDERTGLIPLKVTKLSGAFLESVEELALDWSRPATPLSWMLKFRYTELLSMDKTNEIATLISRAL